eukprot:464240_1
MVQMTLMLLFKITLTISIVAVSSIMYDCSNVSQSEIYYDNAADFIGWTVIKNVSQGSYVRISNDVQECSDAACFFLYDYNYDWNSGAVPYFTFADFPEVISPTISTIGFTNISIIVNVYIRNYQQGTCVTLNCAPECLTSYSIGSEFTLISNVTMPLNPKPQFPYPPRAQYIHESLESNAANVHNLQIKFRADGIDDTEDSATACAFDEIRICGTSIPSPSPTAITALPTALPTAFPSANPIIKLTLSASNDSFNMHNITFFMDITFTNVSTSQLDEICLKYFEDTSKTYNSLSLIDEVFLSVLSVLVFQKIDGYDAIKILLYSPTSSLRDNTKQFNCDYTTDTVPLQTKLTIQSITQNISQISKLFITNSSFIQISAPKIAQIFQYSIKIEIFNVTVINIVTPQYIPSTNWFIIIIISSASLILLILILLLCLYYYGKHRNTQKNTIKLENPMVTTIVIRDYADPIDDLDGIEYDLENLYNIFGKQLHYEFSPPFNSVLQYNKFEWNQSMILEFLKSKAVQLSQNIDRGKNFDSLITVISGHGSPGHIFSSDGKLISKLKIHRIFSDNFPINRTIPRIFVFDACAGADEYSRALSHDGNYDNDDEQDDNGDGYKQSYNKWIRGTDNPDYQLAVISAANVGFQSKMNSFGSYFIKALTDKMSVNIKNGNERFLFEICQAVEKELHLDRHKQHPEAQFNGHTSYIKFY